MKKLMIAAAIVCAAVIAQAGAVKWNWSSTVQDGWKNTGTYAAQGGTMYIFNANAENISQQNVLTAFLAGGDWTAGSMDSYTSANGQMSTQSAKTLQSDYKNFSPVHASGSVNYADYFYAMVVDDGKGNEYLYLSASNQKQISTTQDTTLAASVFASSKTYVGEQTSFTTGGAGWYSSVPEPTSGLLLLLGMAGLALRRRRA